MKVQKSNRIQHNHKRQQLIVQIEALRTISKSGWEKSFKGKSSLRNVAMQVPLVPFLRSNRSHFSAGAREVDQTLLEITLEREIFLIKVTKMLIRESTDWMIWENRATVMNDTESISVNEDSASPAIPLHGASKSNLRRLCRLFHRC